MAFQTRDEAQDKVSRKLDRVLNKKKKIVLRLRLIVARIVAEQACF